VVATLLEHARKVVPGREAAVTGIAASVTGLLLGVCILCASLLPTKWSVLLLGACVVPFAMMVVPNVRRLLLIIIVLDTLIPVDISLRYREWFDTLGGLGGFNFSATTACLILLYFMWLAPALARKTEFAWPPLRTWLPAAVYLFFIILSLGSARDPKLSLREIFLLGQVFLLFIYVIATVKTPNEVMFFVMALLIGLLFESLTVIGVRLVGRNIEIGPIIMRIGEGGRAGGTFGSPNSTGGFLSFLLALALSTLMIPGSRGRHWLAILAFVLGGVALVFTLSRGGWLAFAISTALLCSVALYRGWLPPAVPIVIVLSAALLLGVFYGKIRDRLFGDDEGAAESRLVLVEVALDTIKHDPIRGIGANNYALIVEDYLLLQDSEDDALWLYTVHNKYLLVWAEIGIGGLLAYLWFLLSGVYRGWHCWRWQDRLLSPLGLGLAAALVGQMTHMMVELYNDRPQVQGLWLVIGLVTAMSLMDGSEHHVAQPAG